MTTTIPAGDDGRTGSVDRVLLASPRSFCAGRDGDQGAGADGPRLRSARVLLPRRGPQPARVERFRRTGVVFVDDIDEVPAGAPVLLSAHGTAPGVERAARERTHLVVDAACPLVRKVHHEISRRAGQGHLVLYAGHDGHDETVGALAVAKGATRLVESPADVDALEARLTGGDVPVAFLAQTTLGEEEWSAIYAAAARFGTVWLPRRADLCFATTNRQAAAGHGAALRRRGRRRLVDVGQHRCPGAAGPGGDDRRRRRRPPRGAADTVRPPLRPPPIDSEPSERTGQ